MWLRVVPTSLPLNDCWGARIPIVSRPWRALRNRVTGADRWQLAISTNTAGTEFVTASTHRTREEAIAAAVARLTES